MSDDDLSISITNPDGSIVSPILISSPTFDEYFDKPTRISLKIAKGSALDSQGIVKVVRKGTIKLIGHVTKLDGSNPEYDSVICDSAEALLDYRYGQWYRYPAGTRLQDILASSMGASVVGLLAIANGLIPRGSWTLHSGSVYKIDGAGTTSRFGTLTQLYQNATLLTKATAIPTSAGKWWQSADTLYVWTTDNRSPDYWLIIAPNHKDTLIRLGTISNGTATFPVCFEIGVSKLFPTIKALVLAAGLEFNFRKEIDGYVYLDASTTIGKGAESSPVATFIDGKNSEITVGIADGLGKLQALLGIGAGSGLTQQCAAAIDFVTQGTWRESIFQSPGVFGSMLRAATTKVFSDCQDATIYNVRTPGQDWSQSCGNWVGIIRDGYQPTARRIKHISMRSSGDALFEVGQRLRTLQELIKAGDEVQQILSSFYSSHNKNAWSFSLPETNIDSYTPISHQFLLASTDDSTKSSTDKTIGSGEIDPNFPFMVLLNLKIGWFTASIYSATTAAQSHSSVGGHSNYGGGATSAETQDKHVVPSYTAPAPGQQATSVCVSINMADISGHTATYSNTNALRQTFEQRSHEHSYVDYYCSGVWVQGGHYHGHGFSTADVSHRTHTHQLPSTNTYDASAQSHGTPIIPTATRAGSSAHPEVQAVLEGLINQYATGKSVHYLTLMVTVNGVAVPGSPFSGVAGAGLYVGDSIDSIDISSLVVVGQKNTIAITVSEWGGSGAVKCSVSGNVNVNAVISAF